MGTTDLGVRPGGEDIRSRGGGGAVGEESFVDCTKYLLWHFTSAQLPT